jgi:hypothetical protein
MMKMKKMPFGYQIKLDEVGTVGATDNGADIKDGSEGFGGFTHEGLQYSIIVYKKDKDIISIKLIRADGQIIIDTEMGNINHIERKVMEDWKEHISKVTTRACRRV